MAYVVTAPAVAVSVPAGPRVSHVKFVEAGSQLPEGVDEAAITHLLAMGMIAKVQPIEAEIEGSPAGEASGGEADDLDADQTKDGAELDLDGLDLAGLRAFAAEQGIDLLGATKKADLVAVIRAAL